MNLSVMMKVGFSVTEKVVLRTSIVSVICYFPLGKKPMDH